MWRRTSLKYTKFNILCSWQSLHSWYSILPTSNSDLSLNRSAKGLLLRTLEWLLGSLFVKFTGLHSLSHLPCPPHSFIWPLQLLSPCIPSLLLLHWLCFSFVHISPTSWILLLWSLCLELSSAAYIHAQYLTS